MLTIKQEQLLSQLEAFDLECENMRDQLESARDNSSNTNYELTDVVKQKERLHNENTRLQVCDVTLPINALTIVHICFEAVLLKFKIWCAGRALDSKLLYGAWFSRHAALIVEH